MPARRSWLGSLWRSLFRRVREVSHLLVPAQVDEGTAKIAVKGVDHRYANHVEALRDVSLHIRSGEFVCLLGPSGCGKTTLLYALAGQIAPTGGGVYIDGRPITGPGPERLLMFQDAALYPWRTVLQNITFVLAARGLPRAERNRRARAWLKVVQLEGFEDTLPHQLSGGMKMRASLARALAVDSPVLLMDEPFGSLDAQTRANMHELMQRIWRQTRKTIVFVTHDVSEALMLASRVVVMAPRPGRILRDLEVHLPMPRSPDDEDLVELAREIRRILRESERLGPPERSGGPRAPAQEGRAEAMGGGPAEAGPARRGAWTLGAGG